MTADADLSRVRLLALDIDGTLLTTDHRVLPEVRQAFEEAQKAGLRLVLASARSPGALYHIMADLDHTGPCICFSGAWVGSIDAIQGTALVDEEHTIPQHSAVAVAEAAVAAGLVPSWHTQRSWNVPKMSPTVEREMSVTRQTPAVTPDLSGLSAPNKVLLIGPRDLLISLRDDLSTSHGHNFEAVFSHQTYLEILPKGTDKARAVISLARRLEVAQTEIAAVGDAQNDLGMIRSAQFGVAMANATDEVRQAADWITATNDEGGVAILIRKLLDARR